MRYPSFYLRHSTFVNPNRGFPNDGFINQTKRYVLFCRKTTWSPYTIKGQKEKFRAEGLTEKDGKWFLVPGRVDRFSYLLLVFFVAVIIFLALFDHLV